MSMNMQDVANAYVRLQRMSEQGVYSMPEVSEDLKILLAYVREAMAREVEGDDPGGFERMGRIIRQYTTYGEPG